MKTTSAESKRPSKSLISWINAGRLRYGKGVNWALPVGPFSYLEREQMNKINAEVACMPDWDIMDMIVSGQPKAAPSANKGFKPKSIAKKEDIPMRYVEAPRNLEAEGKDALQELAHSIFIHKDRELMKHFGLLNDDPPNNATEALKRIADGKYVIDAKEEERNPGWNWTNYIAWRDPKVERNRKGYQEAYANLLKAKHKLDVVIAVKSNEDGLKVLEDFEAQTFH